MESLLSIDMSLQKIMVRKYVVRMTLGFMGYALGLVAYNILYGPLHLSPFKWFLFFLPALPMLYVVVTILRFATEFDEMQRKVITETAAFAGLATAFTCFSFLFIRDLGADVRPEWGFYIFIIYYGIAGLSYGRRYR